MNPIERLGAPISSAPVARTERRRNDRFVVPSDRRPAPAVEAAPVTLAGLLAVQERGEAPGADRDAARRGWRLLEELTALQHDLLTGRAGEERLRRLAALADEVPEATDPTLRAAVAAVVIRARIELARYGRT